MPARPLLDEALALAGAIADNAPLAVRWSKQVMQRAAELPEAEGWAINTEAVRGGVLARPTPWRAPSPSPRSASPTGRGGDQVTVPLPGAVSPTLAGIRLSLHVLAAAVWVGGQITLAGLVPTAAAAGGRRSRPWPGPSPVRGRPTPPRRDRDMERLGRRMLDRGRPGRWCSG